MTSATPKKPWRNYEPAAPLEDVYLSLCRLLNDAAQYQDTKPVIICYRNALIRIAATIDRRS